ncbi:MAG: type II secretion system F family protein [Geobacter sp.]|nr:type II secretion system F family protein [Geobacter sp.]
MALYTCKLGSTDGKIIEKEFESADLQALRESLEEQGFFVFEIKKKPFQFLFEKGIARARVGAKDLLTFNQELFVLLKAGLPIMQALDTILERTERGKLADILREVREDIKGGSALSDAFEKHPRAFSHLYIASIRAGERTGDLPLTIRRYIAFVKRVEALKKKLISAMVYPSILVTVAFLAITLLLVFVVPTFSQIYADAGSQLPLPTQILIAITGAVRKYFLVVLLLAGAGLVALRRWLRTERGRFLFDAFILKLPFFGDTFTKYALSNFCRTFATVTGSGIPIVQALRMSVGTLNNKEMERKMLSAIVGIEEGSRLSAAFERMNMMPSLALRMIGVGETTGALEEMLMDVSEHFEEEVEGRLNVLTTAIEPAIMIFMGLVIGGIVITMYLPVFKIAGTVG